MPDTQKESCPVIQKIQDKSIIMNVDPSFDLLSVCEV